MIFDSFWERLTGPVLRPERAGPDGLVAIGGDLKPRRLLDAYRRGVFPWYDTGFPVHWWSPDPRGIIELDGLHISRRLRRTIGSGKFSLTINRDFVGVMRGCADRPEGTWITEEMVEAYTALHLLGHAHSVEAWHDGQLAGGLYGVAVDGLFAGESMFTRVTDASKVTLAYVVDRLNERGFTLFDVQMVGDHTARMGAVNISRAEYLSRLREASKVRAEFA
jgi:leucyl/phenylalanyl-tRNA--protein transferase